MAARQGAEPAAIAAAICREVRKTDGDCENVRLANRASEIAYATCLGYNRRDLLVCSRLRQAYEDDIRAEFGTRQPPGTAGPPSSEKHRALAGLQADAQYRTAEALYKAANSDADTFQAALLIPDIRKKIETALGTRLSDAQLRALIDNNRAEAVSWYGFAQRLRPARGNAAERLGS